MILLLLLVLLVTGCGSPPPAPTPIEKVRPADLFGFETTEFGMPPAEVKANLGWPVAPCQDNGREWCLDSFDVGGYASKVRFFFDDDGLSRVTLTGEPDAYPPMLTTYSNKWGPPDENSTNQAVWTFRSCRITLTGGPRTQMTYTRP